MRSYLTIWAMMVSAGALVALGRFIPWSEVFADAFISGVSLFAHWVLFARGRDK